MRILLTAAILVSTLSTLSWAARAQTADSQAPGASQSVGDQTPIDRASGDQAPGTTQSLGTQSVVVPSLRTAPSAALPPRNNTAAPVPSTRVLGVPVTADAPVSPSYDGTAYKTLGGQAETDQDAISGQVMQPLDSARPK